MSSSRAEHFILLFTLILISSFGSYYFTLGQGINQLVQTLPDDAFYYLQIAKNIANGNGISFDGLYPTNGFHPLWLVLITPLAFIFKTNTSLLYATLSLGAMLNLISIFVLFSICRLIKLSTASSLFLLFLFALNPYYLSQANNGLESSLNILMILVFCRSYIQIVYSTEPLIRAFFVTLAISCAAMLLSRLDNVFLAFSVFVFLFIYRWQNRTRLFMTGVLVSLILAPYLYWNIKNFGSPVPVSGIVETYRTKAQFFANYSHNSEQVYLFNLMQRYYSEIIRASFSSQWLFYTSIIFVFIYAHLKQRIPQLKSALQYATPLMIGVLLQVISIELRWMVRSWYYLSSFPSLIVIIAIFLSVIKSRINKKKLANLITPVLLAVIINFLNLHNHKYAIFSNFNLNQKAMYEGALWMNKNIPDNKIGAFNAGIIGYFYQGKTVNLDGVVNNNIYPYIKSQQIMGYIEKNRITYLADLDFAINKDNPSFLGSDYQKKLVLIKEISNRNQANNNFKIYKISS